MRTALPVFYSLMFLDGVAGVALVVALGQPALVVGPSRGVQSMHHLLPAAHIIISESSSTAVAGIAPA